MPMAAGWVPNDAAAHVAQEQVRGKGAGGLWGVGEGERRRCAFYLLD